MSRYTLGVDTSNYATSLAVFDTAGEVAVSYTHLEGTTDLVHRLADAGVNMQWKGEPKGDKLADRKSVV